MVKLVHNIITLIFLSSNPQKLRDLQHLNVNLSINYIKYSNNKCAMNDYEPPWNCGMSTTIYPISRHSSRVPPKAVMAMSVIILAPLFPPGDSRYSSCNVGVLLRHDTSRSLTQVRLKSTTFNILKNMNSHKQQNLQLLLNGSYNFIFILCLFFYKNIHFQRVYTKEIIKFLSIKNKWF